MIAECSETPSSPTVPQWSKSYIYLGNRLLSTLEPNGSGGEAVRYNHPDRLGTRLITTASETNPGAGTTAQEQVALPFGTALDNESTGATKRRFTSYDRSSMTGLDYAINRHYDPQQGRFTQVDPIGMRSVSLTSPQTLNLYAYCTNDPVNHTDPSGLGFFSFISKIFKAFTKVLKWVVIAVVVTLLVVAVVVSPAAALALLMKIGGLLMKLGIFKSMPLTLNLAAGTIEGGGITIGITGGILSGSAVVGAVANYVDKKKKTPKKEQIVAVIVDVATNKVLAELTQKQLDKYNQEAKAYKACVDRQWDVFKGNIEKVKAAAQKTYEDNQLPWPLQALLGIPAGIGGGGADDSVGSAKERMKDSIPDLINIMAREAEIREGTQRETIAREEAIKNNCKEPALP